MSDRPRVLVTNDDGIDAPGIAALRAALEANCEVVVAAPREDRSGDGRRDARSFSVRRRGPDVRVLDAPPATCVLYGLRGPPATRAADPDPDADPGPATGDDAASGDDGADRDAAGAADGPGASGADHGAGDADGGEDADGNGDSTADRQERRRGFDAVVAGINEGPNLGAFKQGRSGTIGAAVEAAYLGVPAVAVSAYDPDRGHLAGTPDRRAFRGAAAATAHLVRSLVADPGAVFDAVDYLTLNLPTTPPPVGELRVTRPMEGYDVTVRRRDGRDGDADAGHGHHDDDADGADHDAGGADHDDSVDGTDRDPGTPAGRAPERYAVRKRFYDPLRGDVETPGRVEAGTDRGALADGVGSVSPCTVGGRAVAPPAALSATLAAWSDDAPPGRADPPADGE